MINVNKVSEGIDYELIPCADSDNDQAWDVRILTGDYVETVVRFGNIALNGEMNCLNFNFIIISTPDGELTTENVALQEHVGAILEDVLERAMADGNVNLKEIE